MYFEVRRVDILSIYYRGSSLDIIGQSPENLGFDPVGLQPKANDAFALTKTKDG